jgi:proliferating cell nuclear antigen
MGFSALLNDLSLIRESMSSIAELIDETELAISREGIRMIASDRAVVSVVDFFMSRDAFAEYNFEKDERIGINLINFLRILRRALPNDIMKMKVGDSKLELQLVSDSTRTFVLPIIDVSKQDLPPIDKLDFTTHFEINNEILSSGVEDADLITDSVVFSARSDRVVLTAESDNAKSELELTPGNPGLRDLTAPSAARARYSLDYLKKIIKAKKLCEASRISFSTDYPMRISMEVPGRSQLTFILAPRVEE